ncbi:DoxX family protein [Aquimarina agarivorans]|uniref:DoxX family protein n=1 Tax=Aquimarina agarivorans TaxID=980584 RepID=UPI00031C236F|nr:DoxX family protein [Aquimarina agarivorans]
MNLLTVITWLSSLSFIYFGISCFTSDFIIAEFKRYKLPKYRKLTGILQLLGAVGLLFGLYLFPVLLLLASFGLFLLMVAGFIVRIKIKDNFVESSPSFIFASLNLLITLKTMVLYF